MVLLAEHFQHVSVRIKEVDALRDAVIQNFMYFDPLGASCSTAFPVCNNHLATVAPGSLREPYEGGAAIYCMSVAPLVSEDVRTDPLRYGNNADPAPLRNMHCRGTHAQSTGAL